MFGEHRQFFMFSLFKLKKITKKLVFQNNDPLQQTSKQKFEN